MEKKEKKKKKKDKKEKKNEWIYLFILDFSNIFFGFFLLGLFHNLNK